MEQDEIETGRLIEEAEALINAAWHSSDDERFDQLMAWARDIIAPLVVAKVPEAMWVACSFLDDGEKKISEEESQRRFIECIRQAADAGSVSAKFRLACELDADGTREESARLFAEAAEAGHAYAMWCHGLDLLSGSVIEKDTALGVAFIQKSADKKFEGAVQFISESYAEGRHGYPLDEAESARWRKKLGDKDLIRY